MSTTTTTDTCVICLDAITTPSTALPCNHRYDYICLLSWLDIRPSCPLCNTPILHVALFDDTTSTHTLHPVHPPAPPPKPSPSRRHRPLPPPPTPPDLLHRRNIYTTRTLPPHLGSSRLSRFRLPTPQEFRTQPNLCSKARVFIRRELRVFEYITEKEWLLEYCVAVLKCVDIRGSSGVAVEVLGEWVGREEAGVFWGWVGVWCGWREGKEGKRISAGGKGRGRRCDNGHEREGKEWWRGGSGLAVFDAEVRAMMEGEGKRFGGWREEEEERRDEGESRRVRGLAEKGRRRRLRAMEAGKWKGERGERKDPSDAVGKVG